MKYDHKKLMKNTVLIYLFLEEKHNHDFLGKKMWFRTTEAHKNHVLKKMLFIKTEFLFSQTELSAIDGRGNNRPSLDWKQQF